MTARTVQRGRPRPARRLRRRGTGSRAARPRSIGCSRDDRSWAAGVPGRWSRRWRRSRRSSPRAARRRRPMPPTSRRRPACSRRRAAHHRDAGRAGSASAADSGRQPGRSVTTGPGSAGQPTPSAESARSRVTAAADGTPPASAGRLAAPVAVAVVALAVVAARPGQLARAARATRRPRRAPPRRSRHPAPIGHRLRPRLHSGDAPAGGARPPCGRRAAGTDRGRLARSGRRTGSGRSAATGRRADRRLTARTAPRAAALASCLTAVAAEHGGGAVTVVAVDYANFEGAPAVIVEFVDGRGERWAFATGPACGLGSDADVRRRARVG